MLKADVEMTYEIARQVAKEEIEAMGTDLHTTMKNLETRIADLEAKIKDLEAEIKTAGQSASARVETLKTKK